MAPVRTSHFALALVAASAVCVAPAAAGGRETSFAPEAAAALVKNVCVKALQSSQSVSAAAEKLGLLPAQGPDFPLPATFAGAALYAAPSRDGEVFLAVQAGSPTPCQVVIAHVPPSADALTSRALSKHGLAPGAAGASGPTVRWQQLASQDGRINATVLGYEPTDRGSSPIRVIVQLAAR